MLADMAIATQAARLMVYEASRAHRRREGEHLPVIDVQMFGHDTSTRVTDQAIEILGAEGVSADHPIEMFIRDSKLLQIVEGPIRSSD